MKTVTLVSRNQEVIRRMLADGRPDLATAFVHETKAALKHFVFKPGALYDIDGEEMVFAGGGKIKAEYDPQQLNLPGFKGKYRGKYDRNIKQSPFIFIDNSDDWIKLDPNFVEDGLAAGTISELDACDDPYRWIDEDILDEEGVRQESSLLFEEYDKNEGSDQGLSGFGIPYWMETAMGTEWIEAGDYLSDFEDIVYCDWKVESGSNYYGISGTGDIELHSTGDGSQEVEIQLDQHSDWVYGIINGKKTQAVLKKHNPAVDWLTEKYGYLHPVVSWFINWSVDSEALKKQLVELKEEDPDSFNSLYNVSGSWSVSDRDYKNFQDIIDDLAGAPGEIAAATTAKDKPVKVGVAVTARYLKWQRGKHRFSNPNYKHLSSARAKAILQKVVKAKFANRKVTKQELVKWFAKSSLAKTYKPYQFAVAIGSLINEKKNGLPVWPSVSDRIRVLARLSDEARELLLYAQNDGQIYRSRIVPIEKNLQKKYQSGKYRHDMAWKAWMYPLEDAAKLYVKEFGIPGRKWSDIFPKAIRTEAAKVWADEFMEELEAQGGQMHGSVRVKAGEGGFKYNAAKLPVDKARQYAEKTMEASGKSLDEELPNFDQNYQALQKKCKKALDVPRIEMPVIEPDDMKAFDEALKSGHIDIFKPYTKGKIQAPKDLKGPSDPQAEEWIHLGVKDGDNKDDVIKGRWTSIAAAKLLPTQSQIWLDKLIPNIAKFGTPASGGFITKQTIIVSKEGYILDGHHRFGQLMLTDPSISIKALFIPLDIKTLVAIGRSFGNYRGNQQKG